MALCVLAILGNEPSKLSSFNYYPLSGWGGGSAGYCGLVHPKLELVAQTGSPWPSVF